MTGTGVRVTGLRETVRDLERLGVEVADLKEAFAKISRDVAAEAAGLVHVDTGALQRTIRPARTKNKAVVRAGSAGVAYAGMHNYVRPGEGFLTTPANTDLDAKARAIEANLGALVARLNLA